jgi:hypothetical protein
MGVLGEIGPADPATVKSPTAGVLEIAQRPAFLNKTVANVEV